MVYFVNVDFFEGVGMYKKIGGRVKGLREALGEDQLTVADRSGISQATYSRIEQGRVQQPRRLDELASALKTTPEFILFGVDGDTYLTEKSLREKVEQEGVGRENYFSVPLYTKKGLSVGKPERLIWVNKFSGDVAYHKNSFAIYLSDRSLEPKYNKNDVLIINREIDAEPGDMVMAEVCGDIVYGTYSTPTLDSVYICPENKSHPKVSSLDGSIKIIGVKIQAITIS